MTKKDITIKELKERLEKFDENKTLDELYPTELSKLLEDTSFYIKAYWDYDD